MRGAAVEVHMRGGAAVETHIALPVGGSPAYIHMATALSFKWDLAYPITSSYVRARHAYDGVPMLGCWDGEEGWDGVGC